MGEANSIDGLFMDWKMVSEEARLHKMVVAVNH